MPSFVLCILPSTFLARYHPAYDDDWCLGWNAEWIIGITIGDEKGDYYRDPFCQSLLSTRENERRGCVQNQGMCEGGLGMIPEHARLNGLFEIRHAPQPAAQV